jgi:hypothetical protein
MLKILKSLFWATFAVALLAQTAISQTTPQAAISETAAEYGLGRPRPESPLARQTSAPHSEGWWQAFEGGWVYWHPRYGARLVRGKIFDTWSGQRWEQGPLGFPTSGETECRLPDSRDRYQIFEGGRIWWRAATNEADIFRNPTTIGDGGNCSPVAGFNLSDSLNELRRRAAKGGTPAPATPAAPTTQRARFRVTLTGFSCQHETIDTLLEVDGRRDEVYIDSNVWAIERTRGVVSHTSRRSVVMGDTSVSNPPRVRAGTASSERGGIRSGDQVPNSQPWRLSGTKVEDDRLPMLIWEGELVQGPNGPENAAVIMPTIWEWDGADQLARRWTSLLNITFHSPNIAPPNTESPMVELDIRFGGDSQWRGHPERSSYSDAPIYLGGAADRPIGLGYNAGSRSYVFSPRAILLNYQIADRAINHPYTNNGAGVIEIDYAEAADDRNTTGSYSLFLLIERLPS